MQKEEIINHAGKKLILGTFAFLFGFVMFGFATTFAAPPDSPYTPGETLNPSCSPTDTNCTVVQIYVASTTLNYGISTTSPLARLTVSATSSLSSVDLFRVEAVPSAGATSTALIVTSSGRVGVGTTSPYATFGIEMTTTNPSFVISNNGSSTPALYVGGVNQNGFIGIGTSSPATASDRLTLYGGSFFQSVASTTGSGASDQTGMRVVGTTAFPSTSFPTGPLIVQGKYAYEVVGGSGSKRVDIFDISNPTSPQWISNTASGFTSRSIAISGHYLYSTQSSLNDLRVNDVSNPYNPKLVSVLSGFDGYLALSGRYLYVYTNSTLHTFDISNPAFPQLVNSFSISGTAISIFASGRYVYLLDSTSLYVVDVSNPIAPQATGTLTLSTPTGIFVSGRYAYVTDTGDNTFKTIDILNPSSPVLTSTLSIGTAPVDLFVSGRYAYVVDTGSDDLKAIDILSTTTTRILASIPLGSTPTNVEVSGRYAYVSDFSSETFNVIDISGIEVQSAIVHSLEAGSLQTRENASIAGLLNVTGSGTFGSGLLVQGPGAFSLASTTSFSGVTALSAGISDTNNSSIVDIANLYHTSTSTSGATLPAAGIGAGLLFSSADASWLATSTSRIASLLTSVSTTSPTSALTFSNKNTTGSLTEFMRLDSNGNLGIGTTSPYAKLSVVGEVVGANFTATSTTATSTFSGGLLSGGSTGLRVFSNGRVSIGTSTPTNQFEVSAEGSAVIRVINTTQSYIDVNSGVGSPSIDLYSINGTGIGNLGSNYVGSSDLALWARSGRYLVFGTDNLEKMRLDTSGNLGIGTTSPYAKLSVVGEVVAANFTATSTSATSTFAGRVAIGSTTASFPLDVNGIINVGSNGWYSIGGSLLSYASSTNESTIFGLQAGGQNSTTSSAQSDIVAIGFKSLNALTSGIRNTSVGADSSRGITTGSGNTSIGTFSLLTLNDSSDDNTALGMGTLYTGSSIGSRNISIGSKGASSYAESGSGNIDIGAYVLLPSSSASGQLNIGNVIYGTGLYNNNVQSSAPTGGKIGIGTTSPYATLSVVGEVVAANFTATSTTATSSFAGGVTLSTLTGNVGIGTTSPWRKLSVTGTVGIEGLTSNNAANAVCILANNEITTAGGASCLGVSSQRFKHDILESNLGLSAVLSMRPVSFRYNQGFGDSGKTEQFGLIAEEAYQIDSRLAVLDAEGLPTTVRYDFLAPILIKAIQELNVKMEALSSTTSGSFSATSFSENLWQSIISKFSDLGLFLEQTFIRITTLFVGAIHVEDKLCADDVCVNKEQLKALLIQAGGSAAEPPASPFAPQGSTLDPEKGRTLEVSDTTPPTITILGNNPAEIEKGTPYLDLGATVTDDISTNLGLTVIGDQIDTTITGTSIVTYTSTDQAGNTATSTRMVIVKSQGQESDSREVLGESVPSDTSDMAFEVSSSTAPVE